MEKLKFEFTVKAAEDPKTSIICIRSITNVNNHTFLIPDALQPVRLHKAMMNTATFQKVKNTLQRRHESRQVWISITEELKGIYMDEDNNMQFEGYLLQETMPETSKPSAAAGISEEALARILENFADIRKESPKPQNMKQLAEKIVIDKFGKKTSNVSQWMTIFEVECNRVGVTQDTLKIEIFRLFLDDSCLDWYSSMLIKHTVDSEWSVWKKSFCETYADKGWTPVRYAMLYQYKQGTLLEYALKKERLLLEVNKLMDTQTLIDLIATGLPSFIVDKIDRNILKETEDLFNSIRSLEHMVKKKTDKKTGTYYVNKGREKTPCKICEKENKGNRYHPEDLCWFKNKDNDRKKKEWIRHVNNSELETELNEINPKN